MLTTIASPITAAARPGTPEEGRQTAAQARVSLRTLDLRQAASLAKVHPKTLQLLARRGRIPACKIGRSWVFVESLLVEHLVAKSLARVSVADLQEKSECRSTDAKTHCVGGSSYRQSAANRVLYSKALELPTRGRRGRSMTGSPRPDGSKTA